MDADSDEGQPLEGRTAQVWEKFLSNAGERAHQLHLNAQLLQEARAGGTVDSILALLLEGADATAMNTIGSHME